MRSRLRVSAFTLVEILVVIGIICLLAAVLFPTLARVRAVGRRTTCTSNLKQLQLAFSIYAQDHQFYPPVNFDTYLQTQNTCSAWADSLFPYVKDEKIFECPSAPYGQYKSGCPASDATDPQHIVRFDGSYDLNLSKGTVLIASNGSIGGSYPLRYRFGPIMYTHPSSTIFILDGDGGFVSPGYQQPTAQDVATLQRYGVDAHHEGQSNVCFADGHVKLMTMEALLPQGQWKFTGSG